MLRGRPDLPKRGERERRLPKVSQDMMVCTKRVELDTQILVSESNVATRPVDDISFWKGWRVNFTKGTLAASFLPRSQDSESRGLAWVGTVDSVDF